MTLDAAKSLCRFLRKYRRGYTWPIPAQRWNRIEIEVDTDFGVTLVWWDHLGSHVINIGPDGRHRG